MAWRPVGVVAAGLLLVACGAPDYSRVTQWAATASLAADIPPGGPAGPGRPAAEGIRAMQQALTTYLSALSRLSDDGVLPFREDPFAEAAAQAAAADEAGGRAVAALGAVLRRASIAQARAPQLRATIADADPALQDLVAALARAATAAGAEADRRAATAARFARLVAGTPDAATRQLLADAAALRDAGFAARAAQREGFAEVLRRIGEGHALLREESPRLTQAETGRRIAEAEAALARAAARLPRLAPAP